MSSAARDPDSQPAGEGGGTGTPLPILRVDHGAPTAEELAVVVAVLMAAQVEQAGRREDAPDRQPSLWGARARAARPRLSPGPGAWRGSSLPR